MKHSKKVVELDNYRKVKQLHQAMNAKPPDGLPIGKTIERFDDVSEPGKPDMLVVVRPQDPVKAMRDADFVRNFVPRSQQEHAFEGLLDKQSYKLIGYYGQANGRDVVLGDDDIVIDEIVRGDSIVALSACVFKAEDCPKHFVTAVQVEMAERYPNEEKPDEPA